MKERCAGGLRTGEMTQGHNTGQEAPLLPVEERLQGAVSEPQSSASSGGSRAGRVILAKRRH